MKISPAELELPVKSSVAPVRFAVVIMLPFETQVTETQPNCMFCVSAFAVPPKAKQKASPATPPNHSFFTLPPAQRLCGTFILHWYGQSEFQTSEILTNSRARIVLIMQMLFTLPTQFLGL